MAEAIANQNNHLAIEASVSEQSRKQLILEHEQLILRTASAATHRFITTSDDEWSVALCAFSRAIDLYSDSRGDFLPFAQMLIKRNLIDYYRSEKKHLQEVCIAPHVLEGNGEPEEDTEGVYLALVNAGKEKVDTNLQDEILTANEMLEEYGFRFFDLTACSPKQEKTRMECAAAIRVVLRQPPDILEELKRTKKLPIKAIVESTGISKKTLDRYRKYIIMAALVLEGDFPHIADYLKFVKEDAAL